MLNAIIIDDEQQCIDTLQLMIEKKFNHLVNITATTTQATKGLEIIKQQQPQLVFIDVEMPEMTGIELLQQIPNINFYIIFTTAHQHYALQAIKLNALDYLTKPIGLADLETAINKCSNKQQQSNNQLIQNILQQIKTPATKKIAIPFGNTTQFVSINEIVRVEAESNYCTVHFTNRPKQLVSKTLKEFEEHLLHHNFIRVHQSHLVNAEHIIGFKNQDSGYLILYNNVLVEISRRKKQEVLRQLDLL